MKKILGLILVVFCIKLSANDTTYVVLPEAQLKLLAVANGGMGNLDCEIRFQSSYNYYDTKQIIYEFNNKKIIIPRYNRGQEITQKINCGDLLTNNRTIEPIKIICNDGSNFKIEIKYKESILIQNIIATPKSSAQKSHLLAPVANLISFDSLNIYFGVTITALADCEVTIRSKNSNSQSDVYDAQWIKLTRNQCYSIEQLLNNKKEVRFHILNSFIEIHSDQPILTTQYYFENKLPDYFGFNTAELDKQFSTSNRYFNFYQLTHIDITGFNYCRFISQNSSADEFYLLSRGTNELYINGEKSTFTKDTLFFILAKNDMDLLYRNPILLLPANINSNYALIAKYSPNNFDSFVAYYFYKKEQNRIKDSLKLELHFRYDDDLPPSTPPDEKLGRKNEWQKKSVNGTGDGSTASGRWGRGSTGVGGSADSGTRKGPRRAMRAGVVGYAFTCNTSNLKDAPRGTYNIEVEVDCNMNKTYIGYRGGTAEDDPADGKSVAKTVQAFLNCATITKTSTSVCPQRVIVSFTVE